MGDPPRLPVTPSSKRRAPSVADLSSVKNVVDDSKPLAGRSVMIPVTRQAFFKGHLQPSKSAADATDASTNNTVTNSTSEERVLANLGDGFLADMSRQEAADFIQRRIDAFSGTKTSFATKGAKAGHKKTKSVLKNKRQKRSPQPIAPATNPTILPFFEIREELDAEGREVKAEAVNVANEMKALKDAMRSQTDVAEGKETKEIHELIENIDIGADAGVDYGSDAGVAVGDAGEAVSQAIEEPKHEPVSEETYNSLSAKLDKLVRLEEEAERKEREGKSSRQRIEGKAWGEGFLSGGSGGTGKKKTSSPNKNQKEANAGGWNKGFLNAEAKSGKKKKAAIAATTPNASEDPDTRNRKVAFGENEVKEIPRIGQNSIKEFQQRQNAASVTPITPPSQHESEPIDSNIFSGVVMERPADQSRGLQVNHSQQPVREAEQQQQQQPQQPPKKLSKFAQRRLEQRGEL